MYKKLASIYKTPLLLSFTLGIILVAVSVQREPIQIAIIFLGAILGAILLDLDYFINAYFIDPASDFSRTIRGFLKHGDFVNALGFINYNKSQLKEKTLNSAMFQLVLAAAAYFVVTASLSLFLKALLLSTFVNSVYRMAEEYHNDPTLSEWLWILNTKLTKQGVLAYAGAMGIICVILISLF